MNLVKHMSSNTTYRACLAYTRQSAFGRRQSLPRVSYTSTMKQIMGCYHLHIERTQTVRKKSSVGNDRPLSLICLLRSSSFSEAGPQALPSVLTSVHGPAFVLLVVVPGPSPLCFLRPKIKRPKSSPNWLFRKYPNSEYYTCILFYQTYR